MTVSKTTHAGAPVTSDWVRLARSYFTNRWALAVLGAGLLGIASYLNWGWLAAAGIAPILLSIAPCAIMCGLGLCGMKMMGGSCEKKSATSTDTKSADTSGAEHDLR